MEGHVRVQRWFEGRKDRRVIKNYILQYGVIGNMNAVRLLIAFFMLVPLAFSATTISGNQSSYNPGDPINITLENDNGTLVETTEQLNLTNGPHTILCGNGDWVSTTGNLTVNISCFVPNYLTNGTWNISAHSLTNPNDKNTTSQFILNSTNMTLAVESPKTFAPGYNFTIFVNITYWNGDWFGLNVSNFNPIFNVSGIANCSTLINSSLGRYNATCPINSSALAGRYLINGTYPNSNASDSFNVSASYGIPNVSVNVTTIRMDKGNTTYVNITLKSNSNINDTLNINVSGCDGVNLICTIYSALPNNQTNISAFGFANATLKIDSATGASPISYAINVTVARWNDNDSTNMTNFTLNVNYYHNFTWESISSPTNTTTPASQNVTYKFNVTNIGDTPVNFTFSCTSSNLKFRCYFNISNNVTSSSVGINATIDVEMSVIISYLAEVGESGETNVTVTDNFGLSRVLKIGPSLHYTTTAASNFGNVTVTNVTQFVHYSSEVYYFNISINNTANVDYETLYNISIWARNTSGWVLNVSNESGFSLMSLNDTYILNLTLNITKLSSKNILFRIVVPSGASYLNSTMVIISAVSATNGLRCANGSFMIKIPYFNFTLNMTYNNATGTEHLNFTILNITREDDLNIVSFSNLTYNITMTSGTLMVFNGSASVGTRYFINTINISAWPAGAYVLNIKMSTNDTIPHNFSFNGTFYIARWINFTMPTTLPSTVSGQNFSLAITSAFGNTSIATNVSGSSQKPVINYFIGGTCPGPPSISGATFTYTCTATATTNATYTIKASITAASCSSDFTCTFIPGHFTNGSSTINETYSPGTTGDGQQGAPPSGNATNRTTTTTTGIKITVPSNVTLLNTSQTIYIPLNNTNTSRQNISVNISEASDYLHFNLTYIAPKNISGNSTSSINITLTPFKWAKPGSYIVTVGINSANSTFTVIVPQPNDTKKIHRYVEVSKNRTTSMVTLSVKNRNSYSVFMNVTENISKQIAASASNLTITSAINYTIIEQDPVIMWMMNMSPNQERSIIYLVGGDLGNSNLFIEPNISEGRMSAGGGGGGGVGGDMTWLIVGIIVVVVIVAVVVYLFFLKPRGIKLPIKYGAFVKQEKKGEGVLGVLKGGPAKIMSIFKRGEKKEAPVGEKKSLLSRLSFKKKAEVKEEPKEEKKIEPGKPKPTKEDLLKKLNEVYRK
jgi:hypothetical protein